MNFTSEIKKEIIASLQKRARKLTKDDALKRFRIAVLSAYLRACAEFGIKDGAPTFFLVTETEAVAEFFISTFTDAFSAELTVVATLDRLSGRDKLVLQCPASRSSEILKELKLLRRDCAEFRDGISSRFKNDDDLLIAYVLGAFLGSGSCTLPSEKSKSGYHLEFVYSEKKTADEFCEMLWRKDILAKIVKRKDRFVVYVNVKEVISDFLSVIGLKNCLKKFSEVVEKRDEANRSNRAANCYSGNVEKTVQASVKQVLAIEKLKNSSVFDELSEELKTLAEFRLANPTTSLQELADALKISKSCLNHRMRRLTELAGKIENAEK